MTSKQIIQLIRKQAGQVTSDIIKDLIEQHRPIRDKTQKLYDEYLGKVEIKNRVFKDNNKINNKLANDYRGDIVDGIVGYMFGEPVAYEINKDKYSKTEYNKLVDELHSFKSRNDIEDLDSTTGEMMSICGYAARLLYIDKQGKERVMAIKPWEAIFINDATIDEIQYAMIYYQVEVAEGNDKKQKARVEWYDKANVTYYIESDDDGFTLDSTAEINPQPHLFDYVPVIKFPNNNADKGDFEKVSELIDAYDRLASDLQNEVEEFRLAYLAFYGVEPTPKVMAEARQTGAFGFPEGTDGKFITKPLNNAVEFIKDHKKTLNDNIYKFSKSIDMRDEQFSGSAMSGESRKWKLVGLENRAKNKERKFTKGLRYQFKVLTSAWAKKELKLNYEDIEYQFTRNLPVDMNYQAETTQKLRGNISDKTRVSLLPFVPDPEKELQQMRDEAGDIVDFGKQPAQ